MKVSILVSEINHPVLAYIRRWASQVTEHQIEVVHSKMDLSGGELLFLVSCHELIGPKTRKKYQHTLVLHASDLPEGRGWSPLVWQILEGRREIICTLLEAAEPVDSGDIWAQLPIQFEGHELFDEINDKLFRVELDLIRFAIESFGRMVPRPQGAGPASYYARRTPSDSALDPNRSLAEQFDLLRIADPDRYPAYFDLHGQRYSLRIGKIKQEEA